MLDLGTLYSASLTPIFLFIPSTWSNLARPGELSSPRLASYFTPKSFGGLGELEASLGELGLKKSLKWPFCPYLWVSFAFLIKTLNDYLFRTVIGVWHASGLARIKRSTNDSPRTKLGYDTSQGSYLPFFSRKLPIVFSCIFAWGWA